MRRGVGWIVVCALAGWALVLGIPSYGVAAVAVERDGVLNVVQSVKAAEASSVSDLYAFSGSLASGFSEPEIISEPGDSIAVVLSGLPEPQVVADSSGDVLAAWDAERLYQAFSDSHPYTRRISRGVWYAWRPAGATSFQAPKQLLPPGPVSQIKLAMNGSGEAVAAYSEGSSVYMRRFTANGTFGPPQLIAAGAGSSAEEAATLLGIGLAESGELVAVMATRRLVQARFAARAQSLGAPQTLTATAQPFLRVDRPFMAVNTHGDAVVLLQGDERLQADYRVAGEGFGKLQPLTLAQSEAVSTIPTSIAIDGYGHATVAMEVWHPREANVPHVLEVSESSTAGVFVAPTAIQSLPAGSGVELIGGVNGETALFTYTEESLPTPPSSNEPFTTRMRLSSEGGAFGAPQTVEAGTTGWEPGCGYREPEGTSGVQWRAPRFPTFAQAQTQGFYALQAFHEAICPLESKLGRSFVQIQDNDLEGVGKPVSVALPPRPLPVIPHTVEPQPASELEIGHSGYAHISTHGYLQGKLTCGTREGHDCEVKIVLTPQSHPLQIIAESYVTIKAFSTSPLRVRLRRYARAEIDRDKQLTTTITVSTLGERAPPTTSEYPLRILPPLLHHHPYRRKHPRGRHRRHRPKRHRCDQVKRRPCAHPSR